MSVFSGFEQRSGGDGEPAELVCRRQVASSERRAFADVLRWLRGVCHPRLLAVRRADYASGVLTLRCGYATQNLAQLLASAPSGYTEHAAAVLAFEVLEGLHYLHASRVFHAHLSSEDVLIDESGHAVVANFFLARPTDSTNAVYVCHKDYRPPEIISKIGVVDGAKVDVWSLGCVLFEIATRTQLFAATTVGEGGRPQTKLVKEQLRDVLRVTGSPEDADTVGFPEPQRAFFRSEKAVAGVAAAVVSQLAFPSERPEEWAALVEGCLQFGASKRASTAALLASPLFARLGLRSAPEVAAVPLRPFAAGGDAAHGTADADALEEAVAAWGGSRDTE